MSACTGRFSVDGIVNSHAEPVRNPVNRAPHRVKVTLAEGFEFIEAELAAARRRQVVRFHTIGLIDTPTWQ